MSSQPLTIRVHGVPGNPQPGFSCKELGDKYQTVMTAAEAEGEAAFVSACSDARKTANAFDNITLAACRAFSDRTGRKATATLEDCNDLASSCFRGIYLCEDSTQYTIRPELGTVEQALAFGRIDGHVSALIRFPWCRPPNLQKIRIDPVDSCLADVLGSEPDDQHPFSGASNPMKLGPSGENPSQRSLVAADPSTLKVAHGASSPVYDAFSSSTRAVRVKVEDGSSPSSDEKQTVGGTRKRQGNQPQQRKFRGGE